MDLTEEMAEAAAKAAFEAAHGDLWADAPAWMKDVRRVEARAALQAALSVLEKLVRQFAFDIVMGELGMDDQDMDDQQYAFEAVGKWMEHWATISGIK